MSSSLQVLQKILAKHFNVYNLIKRNSFSDHFMNLRQLVIKPDAARHDSGYRYLNVVGIGDDVGNGPTGVLVSQYCDSLHFTITGHLSPFLIIDSISGEITLTTRLACIMDAGSDLSTMNIEIRGLGTHAAHGGITPSPSIHGAL